MLGPYYLPTIFMSRMLSPEEELSRSRHRETLMLQVCQALFALRPHVEKHFAQIADTEIGVDDVKQFFRDNFEGIIVDEAAIVDALHEDPDPQFEAEERATYISNEVTTFTQNLGRSIINALLLFIEEGVSKEGKKEFFWSELCKRAPERKGIQEMMEGHVISSEQLQTVMASLQANDAFKNALSESAQADARLIYDVEISIVD